MMNEHADKQISLGWVIAVIILVQAYVRPATRQCGR